MALESLSLVSPTTRDLKSFIFVLPVALYSALSRAFLKIIFSHSHVFIRLIFL